MSNYQIKQVLKKVLKGQIIETSFFCKACKSDTTCRVDISNEKVTCLKCRTDYQVEEMIFTEIFNKLKKQFGDALVIR